MPVDDANLEKVIASLSVKISEVSTLRGQLKECLNNAHSIRKIDVPDPIPADTQRTKKELPEDRILGGKINATRRQDVYDKIITDAVTFLA